MVYFLSICNSLDGEKCVNIWRMVLGAELKMRGLMMSSEMESYFRGVKRGKHLFCFALFIISCWIVAYFTACNDLCTNINLHTVKYG